MQKIQGPQFVREVQLGPLRGFAGLNLTTPPEKGNAFLRLMGKAEFCTRHIFGSCVTPGSPEIVSAARVSVARKNSEPVLQPAPKPKVPERHSSAPAVLPSSPDPNDGVVTADPDIKRPSMSTKERVFHILIGSTMSGLFETGYHIGAFVVNLFRMIIEPFVVGIKTKSFTNGFKVLVERFTDCLTNVNQMVRNSLRIVPLGIGHILGATFDYTESLLLHTPGIKWCADKVDRFAHSRTIIDENGKEVPHPHSALCIFKNYSDNQLEVVSNAFGKIKSYTHDMSKLRG